MIILILIDIILFPAFLLFTIIGFLPMKMMETDTLSFKDWFIWWNTLGFLRRDNE